MAIRLRYETGIAATIQFIAISGLNFIDFGSKAISECHLNSSGCSGYIVTELVLFIALSVMFGFVWLIGFATQDLRSRRFAKLLIAVELLVLLIGLFDIEHHNSSILGVLSSLVEIISSIWVSWLALKLIRAKGGRVRSRTVRKHTKAQS